MKNTFANVLKLGLLSLLINNLNASPLGVVIYTPFEGASPQVLSFNVVVYRSADLAVFDDNVIHNPRISSIIYFDKSTLNKDMFPFYSTKQTVLYCDSLESTKENATLESSLNKFKDLTQKYPILTQYFKPTNLENFLTRYKNGDRLVRGKWLNKEEYVKLTNPEVKGFTLKLNSGDSYVGASIVGSDKDSISIMHRDGAARVKYKDISLDNSMGEFSDDVAKKIIEENEKELVRKQQEADRIKNH